MKGKWTICALLAVVLIMIPALPVWADSTPGQLDPGFDPGSGANDTVYAAVRQSNGGVIVAGTFTQFDGTSRPRIARLGRDGSLDTAFFLPSTGASSTIYDLALQQDDKVIAVGAFSSYRGTPRNRVARIKTDGTLDSTFDPGTGANNTVYAVALQPDGKVLIGGKFTSVNGTSRNRIARLNADGSVDTTFNPGSGANDTVNSIVVQPNGSVIIGGAFTQVDGTARTRIARFYGNGRLDTNFDPGTGASGTVSTIALQPNGRLLIGGAFTQFNGVGRTRIARLYSNGKLDTTFNPGTGANSTVKSLAVQPDGKVLVGGLFTQINGWARNRIARLNAGGSMDVTFDPGTGANAFVNKLVLQTDERLLVAGDFSTMNGISRSGIARLNPDGTLDDGLDTGNGITSANVQCMATAADDKVIVGGWFSMVDGWGRNNIVRFNADGSVDQTFASIPGSGPDNYVFAVAPLDDGKVLVGGNFANVDGVARANLARLNANGTLDTGFTPAVNNWVYDIIVQPDGKILIAGRFTNVNSVGRNRIARLNANGSLDTSFDPGDGPNDSLYDMELQPDGKILIGGFFNTYAGVGRNRIARILAGGGLDTGFSTGTGADDYVDSIAVQSDGKVIIGGSFNTINGSSYDYLARLNSNGSVDTSFSIGSGLGHLPHDILVQPDDSILIGGQFSTVGGTFCSKIARLRPNGALDTDFYPGNGPNAKVSAIALQPGGRVIIAGDFTTHDGEDSPSVARLNGGTPAAFTNGALPEADLDQPYSFTFTATGFPAPTFQIISGQLPPNIALNSRTGVLSGVPTTGGEYQLIVQASNYVGSGDQQIQMLTVKGTKIFLPLVARDH